SFTCHSQHIPGGQIAARDLASATPTATAPAGAGIKYTDIPLTSLRQSLAERLLRAKPTVPHWYFSVDIKMDAALKLREEFNRALQKDNIKISVNDLVIKATALACTKVPQANSSWQGTFIRQYKSVNVCMSVDTPRGLVIPVVHAAEKKARILLHVTTRSLALKARDNKLQPHDLEGGTVSVTNVGMIGVTSFPGMVNPPQACTVGVCRTKDILVPDEVSSLGHRRVKMMSVSMSCDHRVMDEEVAMHWLHHFKRLLERPDLMLL
ncbi:dihydrolipoamide acetyltransferase, putative, partial [Ixodes scapularis]